MGLRCVALPRCLTPTIERYEFGYTTGYMYPNRANTEAPGRSDLALYDGLFLWLGDRDSNPNYLIQSQAFYR